jgi:hypothetical protein
MKLVVVDPNSNRTSMTLRILGRNGFGGIIKGIVGTRHAEIEYEMARLTWWFRTGLTLWP